MPLSGYTILAVDDNEAENYAIARMLEHANATVLRAGTGQGALDLAQRNPDAIVLDINLPDFDGWEVFQRLKKDAGTAGIPVIFLTSTAANAGSRMTAQTLQAPLMFYPVDPEELVMVIKGHIARCTDAKRRP